MDIKSYGLNKLDDEGFNTIERVINDSELKWIDAKIGHSDDDECIVDKKWRTCKTSFLDFSTKFRYSSSVMTFVSHSRVTMLNTSYSLLGLFFITCFKLITVSS